MARPAVNAISKKIAEKFNMTMKVYASERGLSYNSLKMFSAGIYQEHKKIKEQLIRDGILTDGRPE